MNVEAALAERIGPLAGRLHTGRSRNDQVATDLRLWTRRAIDDLDAALVDFERALRRPRRARRDGRPARARPTSSRPSRSCSRHHLLAYVEMAERDRGRLADARARLNVSPLGAGALAGAGYPLDREATAARARLRWRHRELARRGLGPRLRGRDDGGDRARDGPPQPAGRGGHVVVEPAVRVRAGRRRLLDRQLDDAQQEEPRPGRAGPWPRCPRHRGADRGPDHCSRACRSRTSATSRRASAPLFDAVAVFETSLRRDGRAGRDARGRRRRGCARPPARATRPRPRWPTRWSGAVSRSVPPTTSSARSWPRPRRPASALDEVPDDDGRAGARGERRPDGRRPGRRSPGSATRSGRPPRSTARSPRATSSAGPRRNRVAAALAEARSRLDAG